HMDCFTMSYVSGPGNISVALLSTDDLSFFPGTDFSIESLPLLRHKQHQWALFHEESPKNNYKLFHLFNHTAALTCPSPRPQTHLLPLSYKNQLRRTLASVAYVQSDCDPPSDRDVYVQGLMQHIQVYSYGQYSTAMDDHDFYQILSQYKFILAFENAVCDDYITEKLWRPLKVGVTELLRTPNVRMWLPDNRSAVNPNEPPKKLAQCLNRLDKNDWEYLKYLEWKQKRDISNVNLVTELNTWGVQDMVKITSLMPSSAWCATESGRISTGRKR
uniref:Fucosyltransferase n=1 Tax=Sinocyclocheilus rhinocerous TaxID=307959 RepID=A0A673GWP7_9TELE